MESAGYIIANYSEGINELGLEAIDPLKFDTMFIMHDEDIFSISSNLTNIEVYGVSKAEIYKFGGFNESLVDLHVKIPSAILTGDYELTGTILGISVGGNGKFESTYGSLLYRTQLGENNNNFCLYLLISRGLRFKNEPTT
jgi:hypothetical protein